MSVIITLIIFTVIVVIHEGGHFLAAKKCGVYIEEFAVGMGPKLFGIKRGDILYSVRLFPIGGFCRMADETPEDTDKIGFNDANVFQRILIAFAGPFMNFVLALIILTFISMAMGISTNEVTSVMEGYPAQQAGIEAGDRIVAVNGKGVHIRDELNYYISESGGENIKLTIKRGRDKFTVAVGQKANEEGRALIGITTGFKAPAFDIGIYDAGEIEGLQRAGVIEYITSGWWDMLFLVKLTIIGVIKMLTFSVPMSEISGPIGVTAVVGETYVQTMQSGVIFTVLSMLNLSALLSANLGVINLVPIPALDGGRIFVYLVEIIRRRQLSPEKEGILNLIGFVLVMGFGIFIAVKDVLKLI